jgi:hypothetical protein
VILPALEEYPAVMQVAEARPLSADKYIKEVVDLMYTVGNRREKQYALIIEFKRNSITPSYWTE